MLCYKMTDGDLCCRGVQLRLGKQHIESAADCAARGWHAATDPLCCLTYYSDEKRSRFLLCDAGGDIDEDGSDEKLSCTELTVLRELTRYEFVVHAVAYILRHPQKYPKGYTHGSICIARGVEPCAIGAQDDILAFIRERDGDTAVAVIALDGKEYLGGVPYVLREEVTVNA